MADVTEAPTQDAIAESLLPAEEQAIEQPVTEQAPETEAEAQPVEQQVEQEQVDEAAENWLPSEQDKVFPDETYQQYAQRRYPDLVSALSDENIAEPTRIALRQVLHDKINSDIYIQQQQQIEKPEEAAAEPTPAGPQLTQEQYFQNLTRAVAERTDPAVAKQFHSEFMGIWQLPAEQQPLALAQVTSKYMLNLVSTFLPDMLQSQLSQQLGQAFPGFDQMYDRSSHAMAWDRVRNSNPQFAALPAYGTKDFSSQLRSAAARIPGFDNMQFTDGQGNPLPKMDNAMQKYSMLAQVISGQNVSPQLLQQAAAAGARNARRADVKRAAGNLGSGQSKAGSAQTRTSSQFQTNTDIFDDETMEGWQREHGRI